MSLKPSRRGFMVGMGATAADAVLPVQANTRDDPMAYRAAGELVEALAKRRVSSRELVDSAIARIEALDSKINAVVVRDFDRARWCSRLWVRRRLLRLIWLTPEVE